jgi:hypothetical protein
LADRIEGDGELIPLAVAGATGMAPEWWVRVRWARFLDGVAVE